MIESPIHKALSLIQKHRIRALVMGGQACVLYGASEFSRDLDLACVISEGDQGQWDALLTELQAKVIAVPPFEISYLQRGHAVHFRSQRPDMMKLRIDVMSVMRGVADFQALWSRRTTVELDGALTVEVMSLPDLVAAKKTQRDKDWPMIRRLLEADYLQYRDQPSEKKVRFWLREMRTPVFLEAIASANRKLAEEESTARPLIPFALEGDRSSLESALKNEEQRERSADREYWREMRDELYQLRQKQRQS